MIRYFSFGHAEALLITNVDLIKEILQAKCYSFRKPSFYVRVVEPIVGKGVVSAEGDEHKMLRRFLSSTTNRRRRSRTWLM
jgi:cytochrome P450